MEKRLINCGNHVNRFVTVAVNGYENQQMTGSIYHGAAGSNVGFSGWMDFMKIVNQIYDVIKAPKQTVSMRGFGPIREKELHWRQPEEETIQSQVRGRKATFRILLKYRYNASWQGTVTWLEGNQDYLFTSFLNLLEVMDSILCERKPEDMESCDSNCVCQIAINQYDNSIIQDQSEEPYGVKVITGESLGYYRKGRRQATFIVRILFKEHSTWQGMIYCRERKEEKPFRSFMEMMYLVASALETGIERSEEYSRSDFSDKEYIESIG